MMPAVTHRQDSASALLAKEATTVQLVRCHSSKNALQKTLEKHDNVRVASEKTTKYDRIAAKAKYRTYENILLNFNHNVCLSS